MSLTTLLLCAGVFLTTRMRSAGVFLTTLLRPAGFGPSNHMRVGTIAAVFAFEPRAVSHLLVSICAGVWVFRGRDAI